MFPVLSVEERRLRFKERRSELEEVMESERIDQLTQEVDRIHEVAFLAETAYTRKVPRHEGPVWFGDEAWKTEYWVQYWDICKAYEEGEDARLQFMGLQHNPYAHEEGTPYSSRKIALEAAWIAGFNGELI